MMIDDAARATTTTAAGRGIGSNSIQNLAYANMLEEAGIPNALRNIAPGQIVGNLAARGADLAYGKANTQLANLLSEIVLDPARMAGVMRRTGPYSENALRDMLRLGVQPNALAAPGQINAQKD